MKNSYRQFVLGFGTLVVLLIVSASAQAANSTRFALTATLQGATVEKPTGVLTTKTTKVKITNKEMLQVLGIVYPAALTQGAVLTANPSSQFLILNTQGVLLQTVDSSVLSLAGLPPVRQGIDNQNTGKFTLKNVWQTYQLTLNADANHAFQLNGAAHGNASYVEGIPAKIVAQAFWAGSGKLEGLNSYVEGTVHFSF